MNNAHEWIDRLLKELFQADHRRLVSWIDNLCEKNTEIVGREVHGAFIYAGIFYRPSNLIGFIGHGRKPLHSSLASDMEDFLKAKQSVEVEKTKLRQVLFYLLEPCNDHQDIRDTLPECLVDIIPEFRSYSRRREPAFTIAGDSRKMATFTKLLPKMEEYSVARMIF